MNRPTSTRGITTWRAFGALLISAAILSGCGLFGSKSKEDSAANVTPVSEGTNEPEKPSDGRGPKPSMEDISLFAQNRKIPVIMYHDVIKERTRRSMWFDCSAKEFEDQMEKIKEEGYTPISIGDLYKHLTEGFEVPDKAIVLTFDDNYQGFYDNAWPILKKYNFPAAMFVHTAYVGDTKGEHPKMSWDTLKELIKDPLFTVGSHTVTHYLDLKDKDEPTQREELEKSKRDLEQELGITIDFLAYPNGSNSEYTQLLSRELGYKMAFTIENGLAEESPNIMAIQRYVHTRLEKAMDEREKAVKGAPPAIFRGPLEAKPVRYETGKFEGVELRMTKGGMPKTVMSEGRDPVKTFVEKEGAVAGINGGFFAMSAIASTDNRMVGPLKTGTMDTIVADDGQYRWDKIRNRPLVMWSDKEIAILPYVPQNMRDPEQFLYFMPDVTDVFMAGVWLVRDGVARTKEEQSTFGASDIQDYRRRAWIGVTAEGEFVAGAATQSVSSEKLAAAIAAAGVKEAVLLDSGFSTSLVFNGKIKASGHSTPTTPSRPVPHAIVIMGEADATTDDATDLKSAYEEDEKPRRRRRR